MNTKNPTDIRIMRYEGWDLGLGTRIWDLEWGGNFSSVLCIFTSDTTYLFVIIGLNLLILYNFYIYLYLFLILAKKFYQFWKVNS